MTPDALIARMDYNLLREQQVSLREVRDALDAAPPENFAAKRAAGHLTGLLHLIDAIRAVADEQGLIDEYLEDDENL